MNIRCSYSGCSANPFSRCLCSDNPQVFCKNHMLDHVETVKKRHRMIKINNFSLEETRNNQIYSVKDACDTFNSIKSNLIQKLKALFQFFYEAFSSTFKEILSKFGKHSNEIDNEINYVEGVAIGKH